MSFAPITERDADRLYEEFARWFVISIEHSRGVVRLTLKHDERVKREHVRMPNEPIEQFIDRFLPFAWRTLWKLT